jgi:hypothetical protein
VELLWGSITPFSRKRVKRRFLISDFSAGNITLCRVQHVALELQVGRACCRQYIPRHAEISRPLTLLTKKDLSSTVRKNRRQPSRSLRMKLALTSCWPMRVWNRAQVSAPLRFQRRGGISGVYTGPGRE